MPLQGKTIALIGAGNMGEALTRGLLANGAIAPRQLVATDVHAERLELFAKSFGVQATGDNAEAVSGADVVLLAVKPQQITEALASFRPAMSSQKLLISIAAGVPTTRIERELGNTTRVVRVMPNTPAQVRTGATALCKGRHATDEDLATAEAILGAVGITVRTEESFLDAVTALSGTGPAYIFLAAEAMMRAGVEMGLGTELSRKLTVQTVLGAARLMAQSEEPPAVLRQRVTSRGGTTEAAMRVMAEGRFVEVFVEAVHAAARRSRELSS